MTEIQVSNSTVLCKLLVRGWTVKAENFDITTYRLTSSDSVVFECRDRAETPNAYTVTISENKTYVSQTQKPTVTVPFVCLPKKYTDNRTELSKGVIKMQSPSVGGGGSSTSGSVTLDAADLNSAVLAFKRQVELLSTVINESIQTTTSAVSSAAAASKVAVEAARESAPASSSTDSTLAQAVQSLQQNNETTNQAIQSQTNNFLHAMQRMEQSFKQVITQNQQFIDHLVSARTRSKAAHNAAVEAKAAESGNVSRPLKAAAKQVQELQKQLASVRNQRASSDPVERQSSLALDVNARDKRASSDPLPANNKHDYITHDPFYRRRQIGCSHVFIPSESEWVSSKNTKKVCVLVSTTSTRGAAEGNKLLVSLSTLNMFIVEIFPKSHIGNFPRVYVRNYDPTGQYSAVKDLSPANKLNNPDQGFDYNTVQYQIFDESKQLLAFENCLLDTVPLFSEVSETITTDQKNLVLEIVQYQDITTAKTALEAELKNSETGLYKQYVQGLLYEIERFKEIQQHVLEHKQTQVHENLRNVKYFEANLSNDIKRAYLDKAIQQTIGKLQARSKRNQDVKLKVVPKASARSIGPRPGAPAPPAGDPPGAVAEASARFIGPRPGAPAPPAGDPPGAVAEASARSIGPRPGTPSSDVTLSNKAIILKNLFPDDNNTGSDTITIDEFYLMYELQNILNLKDYTSVDIVERSTKYVMWLCAIIDYQHPNLYDLVKAYFELLGEGQYYNYDAIHSAHTRLLEDSDVQGRTKLYPGIYSTYVTNFRRQPPHNDASFEYLEDTFRSAPNLNILLHDVLEKIEPQLEEYRAELRLKLRENHFASAPDHLGGETVKLLTEIDNINRLKEWAIGDSNRGAVFHYIKNLLQMPKTDAVVEYISYCLLHLDQTTFFAK